MRRLVLDLDSLVVRGLLGLGLGILLELECLVVDPGEDVQVVRQNLGALLQGLVWSHAAVGGNLEHQLVVVGSLPNTRGLHLVPHTGDWGKNGVDRDHANDLIRFFVGIARQEAAAHLDFHHHVDLLLLVGGADDLLFVDDLQTRGQF